MQNEISTVRWILRTSLAWASLWLVLWAIVAAIIRVIDPDSFDPGEGPMLMVAILGPMGLFTRVAFGILLTIGSHGIRTVERSVIRVAGCGILGTAIVQMPYLGHGDAGVAANGPVFLRGRRHGDDGMVRYRAVVLAPPVNVHFLMRPHVAPSDVA